MTKRLAMLAGLVLAACSTYAQTDCAPDNQECKYKFNYDSPDGWLGWIDDTPSGVNYTAVGSDHGWVNVKADGATLYTDNHTHLLWDEAGKGFNQARIEFKFWGDQGLTGFIKHWTDGVHGVQDCHPTIHPDRASDEVVMLTLYDSGDSFVGAFIGGDLGPLGVVPPPLEGEPTGYAVMALVQKLPGETIPRVLKYVQGPDINQYDDFVRLQVKAWADEGQWIVSATGDRKKWGEEKYHIEAPMVEVPDSKGSVGLDTVVLAKPYCLYGFGGAVSRRIRVDNLTAWK